jgi:uncharacterized protein YdhG (YjbR/CyaY superfamily)
MKTASAKQPAPKKNTAPNDVDAYLATMPENMLPILNKLRSTIKAAAPQAAEVINYGVPYYTYNGALVSFAGGKNHCGFYVLSSKAMKEHEDELKPYDTATTAIRFSIDKPLPVALVKKIVKTRLKENEARKKK